MLGLGFSFSHFLQFLGCLTSTTKSGQQRLRMTADTADLQGRTYYDILGLPVSPRHVTLREIKAAYHRALLTAHPDKVLGATGAELDLVRKAFQILSDDVLRKEYDTKIKGSLIPNMSANNSWFDYKECIRFHRLGRYDLRRRQRHILTSLPLRNRRRICVNRR